MTAGVYVLSCRLTSAPLWLGIYLFLWWFLLVIFGLFLLHWRYELPCQDKLAEFHSTPILGCIRILWLVSHPLGLRLDKAPCGWNSVKGTTLPFPIPYPQQSTNSLPLDPLDESTPNFEQFVNSLSGEDEDNPIHMANLDIFNLLGRSFLLPPEDNGERHMAKIIDIDDHGQPLEDIKFKLKINKDQAEEIMSYNQLMDYIQKGTDAEEDPDSLFKFRDIVAHQAPLESTDPDHKGSKYNVMVEWESGEVTYEPLTLISKDDPITCAVYAKKHDLLDTTGWKHLKKYAKTSKRLIRAVKQSRIRQVRASAQYQHGFQVSKDYNDAIRLDKENSNTH